MKIFAKEKDLAVKIIEYLKDMKWEIYQEVDLKPIGGIADIIATQGKLLWVLECKLSFGLKLLHQAERHLPFANYVSVCTPRRSNYRSDDKILKFLGLGHVMADRYSTHEHCNAPLHRWALISYYKNKLCEEQKTWAEAGSSKGGHFTAFKMTVVNLKLYIRNHPGCSMKEAIDNIEHHYGRQSTAKTSIYTWIREGVITGIILENGKLCLKK